MERRLGTSVQQAVRSVLYPVFAAALGVMNSLAAPTTDELLKRRGFVWRSASTENLRLYFEPGSFAEVRIEHLKARQQDAFARNLKLLAIDTYPHRTDIFVVESRERMKELIGEATNGVAYAGTRVVCFVFSKKTNASGAHELMHVMAGNVWGSKVRPWINEGFAGYADDIWYGYKLHDLGKYLLNNRKLIALDELMEDFRDQPDMLSYPQAASFVKFLYEQYGVAKVREIWKDGSPKSVRRILGVDVATLEKAWHERLRKADATNVRYDLAQTRSGLQRTSSSPSQFGILSLSR